MSENEAVGGSPVSDTPEIDEEVPGYKPPAEKSIKEILEQDDDDESLRRYKEQLIGGEAAVPFPNDPRRVIIQRLALVAEGRPDKVMDLTRDLSEIKKEKFVIKEGVKYSIRIDFTVQREIVTGLKYIQKTSRMGVTVDKMSKMVGSYPPKTEAHSYTTPQDEAPSGLTGRGTYSVSSLFTDDDKNEHLKWDWTIEVKKDWED